MKKIRQLWLAFGSGFFLICALFGLSVHTVLAEEATDSVTVNATVNSGAPVCGNGTQESGEDCDDSNTTNGDGCSSICEVESGGGHSHGCGDGIQDPTTGEQCDDGNTADGDGCSSSCLITSSPVPQPVPTPSAVCGNGIQETGESCDDSNTASGDGCSAMCVLESLCGNRVVEGLEQCDDGNRNNFDGCSSICLIERCGNGVIDTGEECDDGNRLSGDSCDRLCQVPLCGNARIDDTESCDDGNKTNGDGCSATCVAEDNSCAQQWSTYTAQRSYQSNLKAMFDSGQIGEGTYCTQLPGVACDTYTFTHRDVLMSVPLIRRIACAQKDSIGQCLTPVDTTVPTNAQITDHFSYVRTFADGTLRDLDPYCILVAARSNCRNGVLELGEECDDGNSVNTDSCTNSCIFNFSPSGIVCGNSVQEAGEQCDDGNTANSDGCSSLCQMEVAANCVQQWDAYIERHTYYEQKLVESFQGSQLTQTICSTVPDAACDAYYYYTREPQMQTNGIRIPMTIAYYLFGLDGRAEFGVFTSRMDIAREAARQPLNGGQQCYQVNPASGSRCGDFMIWGLEQCDDGNTANGDGCSSICQFEVQANQCITGLEPGCVVPPACENGVGSGCAIPGCFTGNEADCRVSGDGCITGAEAACANIAAGQSAAEQNALTDVCIFGTEASCPKFDEAIDRTVAALERRIEALALPPALKTTARTVVQAIETVQEIAHNPVVEETTRRVIAPGAVGVSVVALTPSLASIVVPLLRYLFLQPILYVGKRKRKEWGQVYDSFTRLPIDLALVRLIDTKQNRVVQSRVTDAQGRYIFIVEPGEYVVEVVKQGYGFPTQLLKNATADGRMLDIYHGEKVFATAEGIVITPNIPLDPIGVEKTIKRIAWEKWFRGVQYAISVAGIISTLVSLYITPSWIIVSFLVLHLGLYRLFVRYIRPKKPKGWGIVYETTTKQPLGHVVARLFTKQYNKLVSAQITDTKGRYAFLVGPNDYYVTFEKPGYVENKLERIIKDEEEQGFINDDVQLKKQTTDIQPAPVVPPSSPAVLPTTPPASPLVKPIISPPTPPVLPTAPPPSSPPIPPTEPRIAPEEKKT